MYAGVTLDILGSCIILFSLLQWMNVRFHVGEGQCHEKDGPLTKLETVKGRVNDDG